MVNAAQIFTDTTVKPSLPPGVLLSNMHLKMKNINDIYHPYSWPYVYKYLQSADQRQMSDNIVTWPNTMHLYYMVQTSQPGTIPPQTRAPPLNLPPCTSACCILPTMWMASLPNHPYPKKYFWYGGNVQGKMYRTTCQAGEMSRGRFP